MMERLRIEIDRIRVPAKRRRTLKPAHAEALAEDMLENGQTTPIRVRADGDAYVLVEGLHRLEACRTLGEADILAYLVKAPLR